MSSVSLRLDFCDSAQVLLTGLMLTGAEYPVVTLSLTEGETETVMTFHNVIFDGSSFSAAQAVDRGPRVFDDYDPSTDYDSSTDYLTDPDEESAAEVEEPKETLLRKISLSMEALAVRLSLLAFS